uniref:Uncharacterized protein n=1 Tax=Rhizophora mucronata TaxID=61149 RepID=A0A2P2PFL0_RHIMU
MLMDYYLLPIQQLTYKYMCQTIKLKSQISKKYSTALISLQEKTKTYL